MHLFRVCACALALIVAGFAFGVKAASGRPATDETNTILRISNLRMRALLNWQQNTWAQYTSDRLQYITDDGVILSKKHMMARKRPSYPDRTTWASQPTVRLIGDIALVTGRTIQSEQFPGGSIFSSYERTELYAKVHGVWKEEASQLTVVPRNHIKGLTFPPLFLRAFVGRYQWAPRLVETLTISGGHLISSFEGSRRPVIFVSRYSITKADDLGVESFYRDATGNIAGYIYRACDGQTVRVLRLPA